MLSGSADSDHRGGPISACPRLPFCAVR